MPDLLETHFTELRRKVDLSSEVVELYGSTYRTLADAAVSNDQKRNAARLFDGKIREFAKELAPFAQDAV
jgi:hypothetical protein